MRSFGHVIYVLAFQVGLFTFPPIALVIWVSDIHIPVRGYPNVVRPIHQATLIIINQNRYLFFGTYGYQPVMFIGTAYKVSFGIKASTIRSLGIIHPK